ncbi:hypothetical protein EJV46_15490 [Roseococcus sp. SYP-B2431]|uniref:hypothetical protein n=1 Tax=Roseococcus sp. SYP-B2431 TaxID=2496640 RepID=UPI0010E4B9B0|nr:hypothetical protein [Roseococcus sp. SYP-B2431]TCH97528.1 hypothetical protein EJV46_15490 [Roseococcus sp. SYP-B2431]
MAAAPRHGHGAGHAEGHARQVQIARFSTSARLAARQEGEHRDKDRSEAALAGGLPLDGPRAILEQASRGLFAMVT